MRRLIAGSRASNPYGSEMYSYSVILVCPRAEHKPSNNIVKISIFIVKKLNYDAYLSKILPIMVGTLLFYLDKRQYLLAEYLAFDYAVVRLVVLLEELAMVHHILSSFD